LPRTKIERTGREIPQIGWAWAKKGSATGSDGKPNRYRKLKPDDFANEFGTPPGF